MRQLAKLECSECGKRELTAALSARYEQWAEVAQREMYSCQGLGGTGLGIVSKPQVCPECVDKLLSGAKDGP